MNRQEKVSQFIVEYRNNLLEAIKKYPEKYAYPVSEVLTVSERMRDAFEKGSYNHDSIAIKWTCKRLGIKHTRKAMEEFFGSR